MKKMPSLKTIFLAVTYTAGVLGTAGGAIILEDADRDIQAAKKKEIVIDQKDIDRRGAVGYAHLAGGILSFAAFGFLNRRRRP